MAVFPLLLFLGFAVLSSANPQNDFNKLSEPYKKGVELALQQINSHSAVQNHFLFFKTLSTSEIDAGFGAKYLFHRLLLKPTKCSRGAAGADYSKCSFRNDRPVVDCGTCYKTYNGAIEEVPKPYIHCIHKPALTKEMISTRLDHCNKMSYSSGSASVLLVKSE